MCGRAGRLTGAPLGCKQQAARWGEASSRMGRSKMREKQQCRQEKLGGRSKCGKQDSAAASSKMGRSKLGKMGEEQAAIQRGDASSKKEAWQARQDKEQAASKMGQTQASSKRGKMGEAV